MLTTDKPPVLEAVGLSKLFAGVAALTDIDLAIGSGEIVGLAGANGAGKSTLINLLTGQFQPDAGELRIDGEAQKFESPRASQRAGIGVVRQELDLVFDLTIAENLFLGEERRYTRWGKLDRVAMAHAAREILERVGLTTPPDRLVRELSIGDRQLVAAARALRDAGSVLLLDEPTSSLTPFEAERLFGVMRTLRDAGVGVVFISHRLNEVTSLCDRVVVLRDGRVAGEFGTDQASTEAMVEAMVPGTAALDRWLRSHELGPPVLRARQLSVNGRTGVDLDIRRGEVVGVFGLVGAGKSSLGRALAGLQHFSVQELTLNDQPYRPRNAGDGFRAGVASLSEDRHHEGILPGLSVRDNIIMRGPRDTAQAGLLRGRPIGRLVAEMFERLRIKAASDRLDIRGLSGGNQQKVLVARLLAEKLSLLILDEPTHGIDIRAKHDLLGQIAQLTASGMAVLMISSEIPELLAAADRIIVMRNGAIAKEIDAAAANEQILMSAATGSTTQ